ncbi:MAG TPA: hypothetical protein VGJ73_17905 [Verrucomicrobiae bacterium]|jgi:hypothetical protein
MNIRVLVGIFFLALSAIFGFAAWQSFLAGQRQWTPAGQTYRRVAIIFALVGAGLILLQLM